MIENSNIQSVLDEMADYESQYPSKWAVDDATGTFLHTWVLEHQPRSILELGTWRGASAIYMGAALQLIGNGKLITVDRDSDRGKDADRNIQRAGLSEFVDHIVLDIDEYLNEQQNQQFDLIFLDAAKKQQGRWLKHLITHNAHKDTVFIIDDVITMADRMQDLYAFLTDHPKLTYTIEDIDDGLMIVRFR